MTLNGLKIRRFQAADAEGSAQLYFRAVREGALAAYTPEQVRAWAPEMPEVDVWHDRLAKDDCFVAEMNGHLAGFMTFDASGYIDLAFVAPEFMGQGVAAALYQQIETVATSKRIEILTVHASLLARNFFLKQGWTILHQEETERAGVSLTRFAMEKKLPFDPERGATAPGENQT